MRKRLFIFFFTLIKVMAQNYDKEYVFRDIFSPGFDLYTNETINAAKYGPIFGITYWYALTNGIEARITHKFPFPKPTTEAFLKCSLDTRARTNSFELRSSGSLWGSENGADWILLMDAPAPISTGYKLYTYETNLPLSIIGSKEIWIQARLLASNENGSAYLPHYPYFTNNAFELKAKLGTRLFIETAAVRLKWFAESNIVYQVQWSTDSLSWSNLATVTGSGGETNLIEWTDQQKKFYRVVQP